MILLKKINSNLRSCANFFRVNFVLILKLWQKIKSNSKSEHKKFFSFVGLEKYRLPEKIIFL